MFPLKCSKRHLTTYLGLELTFPKKKRKKKQRKLGEGVTMVTFTILLCIIFFTIYKYLEMIYINGTLNCILYIDQIMN